jgi:PEP-CTERM motif
MISKESKDSGDGDILAKPPQLMNRRVQPTEGVLTVLRRLLKVSVLAVSVSMVPATSEAAPVLISGNASACFGLGCTPGQTASYLGGLIEYESNPILDFFGFTDAANGTLAINDGTGSFGRLEVGTTFPYAFVNTPFSLLLDFYTPSVADAVFSATILGVVSLDSVGGIAVVFNPFKVTLPYSYGGESGIMDVYALSTVAPSGGSGQLNGFVVAQAVPEPATSLLFGLGALGLLATRKRRA